MSLWAIFDYPKEFVTLPEYTAHAGEKVEILRPFTDEEHEQRPSEDEGFEPMFKIRAADGWEGDAFESELLPA